jgi:hypothetical protein
MRVFNVGAVAYFMNEINVIETTCLLLKGEGRGGDKLPDDLKTRLLLTLSAGLSAFHSSNMSDCQEKIKAVCLRLYRQPEGEIKQITDLPMWDLVDVSTIASQLGTLKEELVKLLAVRKFMTVESELATFVNQDELFGPLVSQKFLSVARDLRDCGNCLAADCGTAAVFHLMRAAEFALRALARDRNISFKDKPLEEKEWAQILDKLELEVKRLRESPRTSWSGAETKDNQVRFYAEVVQELRGFNDAWRRHVSHADTLAFYNPDDAMGIFKHVRTFMQKLSTKISEGGITPEYWT